MAKNTYCEFEPDGHGWMYRLCGWKDRPHPDHPHTPWEKRSATPCGTLTLQNHAKSLPMLPSRQRRSNAVN